MKKKNQFQDLDSGSDLNNLKYFTPSRLTTAMNSKGFSTARNFTPAPEDKSYLYRAIYKTPEQELKQSINKLGIKNSMVLEKSKVLPKEISISQNTEMNQFLKTLLTMKKENANLTEKLLNSMEIIIKNDKLVTQLEQELDYYRNLNLQIQGDLLMTSTRKEQSSKSESQVQAYCKEIKKKFKLIVEKIDEYERQLAQLDNQKENLIATCDVQIERLADCKMSLLEEQETLENKISYQKDVIFDLDRKLSQCINEKTLQKETFDKKNFEDELKYNTLNVKYYDLQDKMKEYINEEAAEEYEDMLMRRALMDLDKEREETNM